MESVDEVCGAHIAFLWGSEAYERLVGDTASRIEEWAHDDLPKRIVLSEDPDLD